MEQVEDPRLENKIHRFNMIFRSMICFLYQIKKKTKVEDAIYRIHSLVHWMHYVK